MRARFHLTVVVSLAFAVVALATPKAAYADQSDEGTRYNGSFLAVGLLGGAYFPEAGAASDVGWVTGAYARISSVLQIGDFQLEYHAAGGRLDSDLGPLNYLRHSISGSINLHPIFLRMLNNNWLWFAITSIYVQFGASAEFAILDEADLEPDVAGPDPAFSMHIGLGFDIPLTQPESSGAFWLGMNWRWKFVYGDWKVRGGKMDPDAHLLMAIISYRYHNLSFTRVERPPELQYR